MMRQNVTSVDAADTGLASRSQKQLADFQIFLVDDSPDVRTLLVVFLKRAGATVTVFESANEALVQLRAFTPDMILSDIGMPELDGYSFMLRYRAMEIELGRVAVPAAALTAFTQPHHAEMALAAGFNKYMTKPITAESLIAAILKLTAQKRSA